MRLDLDMLKRYSDDGLLINQTHPTLPLIIWNYSRRVQYEALWDEITSMCRGLVTDTSGLVVAKPFGKFKNLEEHGVDEIPNEPFEVFEKMDGFCIICFNYNGEWICASRGSFTSEQAVKANELFKNYPVEKLDKSNTYMFEVIY